MKRIIVFLVLILLVNDYASQIADNGISNEVYKKELDTYIQTEDSLGSGGLAHKNMVFVFYFQADTCFTISYIVNETDLKSIYYSHYMKLKNRIVLVYFKSDKYPYLENKYELKKMDTLTENKIRQVLYHDTEDPYFFHPTSSVFCKQNKKATKKLYGNKRGEQVPFGKSIYK
jgi:hypothetical protein